MINETSIYFWAGLFAVGMYVGALNSKALGATIAYSIGLLAVYPSTEKGLVLMFLYIPAVLLAAFRD